MNEQERCYHVSRIIAGDAIVTLNGQTIIIRNPNRIVRLQAELVYKSICEDCLGSGIFDEDELLLFLKRDGLWSDLEQSQLDGLIKDGEELKVKLFELILQSEQRRQVRNNLESCRAKITEYLGKLHAYDHLSAKFIAEVAKHRFLIENSCYTLDGDKINPPYHIDKILEELNRNRLEDSKIRELARTDPWRSIWSTAPKESLPTNLFGVPAVDLTVEQRSLIGWSSFYDMIREHPSCPSDSIIEDDDVLDGWVIVQRRAREAEQVRKDIEDRIPNKIKNSDEIFVVASQEDARKVDVMNNEYTRGIKRQRFKQLKEKREISHNDFKDVQLDIAMAYNREGLPSNGR